MPTRCRSTRYREISAVIPPSLRAKRSNPAFPQQGRLDCFVAIAPRNDGGNIRSRSRSSFSPGLCNFVGPLSIRGRRESRAPTAPAAPCARGRKKRTRVELQVQPGHPGFPRAMVLRFPSRSPRGAAFLAPVLREQAPAGSARVAAPGPHDFAVRCGVFVRRTRLV